MKENGFKRIETLNSQRMLLAYFHPFKTIKTCLILVTISAMIFLGCFGILNRNGSVYNLVFAMTTGVSASAAVTIFAEAMHFKKMRLIRHYAVDRHYKDAQEYLVDFLQQPTMIAGVDEEEVSFIAKYLIEIHRNVLHLEEQVSKEPFYGALIVDRREFDRKYSDVDLMQMIGGESHE